MDSPGLVEFEIRLSDLKKATQQLSLNRGDFKETDFADLLVSCFAATFRAIGTSVDVPVVGIHPGTIRAPLRLLAKLTDVAKTYKARELKWQFEPGAAKVEKFKMNHPDVTLGTLPDPKYDPPADAGPLDTLAMASMLTPQQIVDQGLRERVEAAQKCVAQAVSMAANDLREFGVSRKPLQQLVDDCIHKAALRINPAA